MDLSVRVDTRELERRLGGFQKQIPFAISKALNETAKNATAYVRTDMQRTFTIRGSWETKGSRTNPGVSMNVSTKRNLTAEVGTGHAYMGAHIDGGQRDGDGLKAIPTDKGRGSTVRPLRGSNDRRKLPPGKWPKGLVKPGGRFFMQDVGNFAGKKAGTYSGKNRGTRTEKGKTQARFSPSKRTVVFQRLTKKRYPIQAVYVFDDQIKIKARWPLQKQVEKVVAAKWADNTIKALEYALRTAK